MPRGSFFGSNVLALHFAAKANDLPQVEQLLRKGVYVNTRDESHRTALHYAAMYNSVDSHYEVVQILLKNAANVIAKDNLDRTPLHYLVQSGIVSKKIVQLFLNFKATTAVIKSLDLIYNRSTYYPNEYVEVVQLLIDHGWDFNHCNSLGESGLHRACRLINDRIFYLIKFFLKIGANINIIDNQGHTPLLEAVDYGLGNYENLKKEFNFILEHTDFNLIHTDVNVLNYDYVLFSYSQNYRKDDLGWILKHIAKLQSLKIPVHFSISNTLQNDYDYNKYYQLCMKELSELKNTKLKNSWVNFYNLLVDGRKKIKNYAGNEDLIEDFQNSDCVKKFPIYGASVEENVKKGIRRRELFDKSASLLSICLPIFNPTHLIIKDVLDCVLSKKDLSTFCE